jgi:hypothetical protein
MTRASTQEAFEAEIQELYQRESDEGEGATRPYVLIRPDGGRVYDGITNKGREVVDVEPNQEVSGNKEE